MARNEAPPFSRGETFYNGGTITQDTSTLLYGGYEHEGKIWEFEDLNYTQSGVVGAKTVRSNRMVKCMACRNDSGVTLLPGYLAQLETSGTKVLGKVSGYANVNWQGLVGVIDEWLPSAGVVANDLFWLVVGGPTLVYTPADGGSDNVINNGDPLVSLTAAASTAATTAGRVQAYNGTNTAGLTSNVTNAVSISLNYLGYAVSAATTANTNTQILAVLRPLPWAND